MEEKNEEIARVKSQKIIMVAKNDIIKFRVIKNNVEKIKIGKMIKISERIVINTKRTEIGKMRKEIKRIMINGKMYEKRKE